MGTIPMAVSYPSLNLSQAVMVVAYELSVLSVIRQKHPSKKADPLTLRAARAQIEEILVSMGINSNETLYNRIMERVNSAGEDDLHLLCSIVKYFWKNKD
jgi:tRNA/rRNA methyltransferase